jgi:hypothetical protein
MDISQGNLITMGQGLFMDRHSIYEGAVIAFEILDAELGRLGLQAFENAVTTRNGWIVKTDFV